MKFQVNQGKVKACLEESNDNSKYCQTKKLPQDRYTLNFNLKYEEKENTKKK
jgi:hypothetical protein